MTRREIAFAFALLTAAGLVTYGIALISPPAAFIVGGLELAGGAWLVLSE